MLVLLFSCCIIGHVHILLEYAENGSLQSFLRKHRPGTKKIHEKYINLANQEIKEKDLIRWSYEIAKGMEFLALKMV